MKNIKLIVLFLCICTICAGQDVPVYKLKSPYMIKNYLQIQLNTGPALPLNGTSSYIDKIDLRPVTLSFDYVFKKSAIGLQVSNQYFAQKVNRDDYVYGSTNFSTVMARTLRLKPVLLTFSHFFTKHDSKIRPYAKLGIGLMNINYLAYWGYSPDPKNAWQPTINGLLGLKKEIGKNENLFIDVNVGYQYADFDYDFITKVSVAYIGLGLGYRWQNSNKLANIPFTN